MFFTHIKKLWESCRIIKDTPKTGEIWEFIDKNPFKDDTWTVVILRVVDDYVLYSYHDTKYRKSEKIKHFVSIYKKIKNAGEEHYVYKA